MHEGLLLHTQLHPDDRARALEVSDAYSQLLNRLEDLDPNLPINQQYPPAERQVDLDRALLRLGFMTEIIASYLYPESLYHYTQQLQSRNSFNKVTLRNQ
jgi:hypothetical protein